MNEIALIRGGGRLGTAVAHRLRLCGFPVVIVEAARPTLIHRRACLGAAIEESELTVEGVTARRASGPEGVRQILEDGAVPVLVDPAAAIRQSLVPWVLIDAIGLDRNVGTSRNDAPIVVALGPGFAAGVDAHAVVESRANVDLGRFTTDGPLRTGAIPLSTDAGWPYGAGLVLAPIPGRFEARAALGDTLEPGVLLGVIGGREIKAPRGGLVAGLLADGLFVGPGMRVADIDPGGPEGRLHAIDPLARAAAGGVLEAILHLAALGREAGQSLASRRTDTL
ncbi:MAG: molybdenum hydroxylase [Candidatus Eisenbacteria bacterium]|nr:molybdenum hydroxylase [Candidatus Eisenbacteria bacterium]